MINLQYLKKMVSPWRDFTSQKKRELISCLLENISWLTDFIPLDKILSKLRIPSLDVLSSDDPKDVKNVNNFSIASILYEGHNKLLVSTLDNYGQLNDKFQSTATINRLICYFRGDKRVQERIWDRNNSKRVSIGPNQELSQVSRGCRNSCDSRCGVTYLGPETGSPILPHHQSLLAELSIKAARAIRESEQGLAEEGGREISRRGAGWDPNRYIDVEAVLVA